MGSRLDCSCVCCCFSVSVRFATAARTATRTDRVLSCAARCSTSVVLVSSAHEATLCLSIRNVAYALHINFTLNRAAFYAELFRLSSGESEFELLC